MRSTIGLAQLLGLGDCNSFFENIWEREPYLAYGAIQETRVQILTLDDFEAMLASALPSASSGLSIVERGVACLVSATDPARLLAVEDAYRRRCTLLQSGLQLRWAPLARICRDMENQFLARSVPFAEAVAANSYLTPAHAQGFDLHYDNHCAIVLQLHGSKEWSIFPPTDELPVARCTRPIQRQELQDPIMVTRLRAGDVLYIPRGFPHCAATAEETSLHVTLSLRPMTWAEAMRAFCESQSAFRRSVTPSSMRERARESGQSYFAGTLLPKLSEMHVDAMIQTLAAENLAKLPALPTGGLRAAAAGRDLDLKTPLVRISHVICSETEQGEAMLQFPGAALRLPIQMKPVFEFVAAHEEFTPAMLPIIIEAEYHPLELVRILIKRGLLQVKVESPNEVSVPVTEFEGVV